MVQQIAIAVLVVVMMVAIGLRTAPQDFHTVARRPLPLFATLSANLIVVPLVAFAVTRFVPLEDGVLVGLVLCAVSPGGPAGALFAGQARGHLASAVSALVALSVVAPFTAPLSLGILLGVSSDVDSSALILPMMATLIGLQLFPLLVGMAIRRRAPPLAERLSQPMNAVANALLVVVILGLLATKWQVLVSIGSAGLLVSVGLVFANLGIGALTSRAPDERRAFAMITGVRNLGLALLLSAMYFPAPETDAAILTFGLFTMLLPFGVALALR